MKQINENDDTDENEKKREGKREKKIVRRSKKSRNK